MMFKKVFLVVIEVEILVYRLRNFFWGEFYVMISKFSCFVLEREEVSFIFL